MKSMQRMLLSIVVCCFSAQCHGQAAVEKGSVEAFRIMAESRRQAAEEEADWQASHKLTLLDEIPDKPRGQGSCLPPSDLRDGATGYLECWQYEIVQVVGATDLLLTMNNPRVPFIWLSGYPTEGLADGDRVRLVGLVKVSGVKEYESVGGVERTVRMVMLLSKQELAEAEQAEKERALLRKEQQQVAWAAKEAALYRTWTDNSGKSFEAKFLYFKNNQVHVQRKDSSKEIAVPLRRLSKDDQAWIRGELKARKPTTKP